MVGNEIFQMRPGVRPGEGYIREVAAFLMDHDGFSGVPATMVVEARHKAFHTTVRGGAGLNRTGLNPHARDTAPDWSRPDMTHSRYACSHGSCMCLANVQSGKEARKVGSFQEFVKHDAVVEDLSPSLFPRKEVQKIALMDLRLLNSDRNGGNILVRKRPRKGEAMGAYTPRDGSHYEYQLIPIDHGYCLPEEICIDDSLNLCWFEWRQVRGPS
jgi:hypothetical protein